MSVPRSPTKATTGGDGDSDVQHAVKRADHQTHGERYKGKLHRLFYRLEVLGLANAHFVPTGLPHQDGFLDTSCAF